MSELKARTARSIADIEKMLGADCPIEPTQVYLESEADKVIAELKDKLRHYPMMVALLESDKKEIAELKKACNDKDDWCLHTLKELRHQKYKRCLAMADFCTSEYHRCYAVGNGFWLVRGDTESRDKYRKKADDFWSKWRKRWRELAEKFKEVK